MARKRKRRSGSAKRPATSARPATARATPKAPPPRSGFRAVLERYGRPLTIGLVIVVVVGGYYLYLLYQARRPAGPPAFLSPAPSLSQQADLPGLQTAPPPWSPATATLRDRLDRIGLPALGSEGTAVHTHQHLDVFVHGRPVTVPAEVGIDPAAGFLSPIHTHDDSGVIHVESPTERVYSLGQVFDVWGVRFTAECLGGDCDQGTERLRVFVGGEPVRGDPRLLELSEHQEIVVTFGTPAQVPQPVPSRYSFPIGV